MKRLTKDQKASIRLAIRDAVFQQLADLEETITEDGTEEAMRSLDRQNINLDDDTLNEATYKEMKAIFIRIYDAVKKGQED